MLSRDVQSLASTRCDAGIHLVPRERFFVGTRKTDDGDVGGIAEEV
jgi:hypothetical protein